VDTHDLNIHAARLIMTKRTSNKLLMDVSQLASDILVDAVGKPEFTNLHGQKNSAVDGLGRMGTLKETKQSMGNLPPKKRTKPAKKAA
jgi:hypothetical protein